MRVMIIDDSVIAREGLRRLLESEGHQVLATLGRIDRVPDAVERGRPDAVILDIRMPPTFTDEGVQLGIELRVAWPELAILVLSQYAVPEYATRLLERGASGTGYLLKDRIFEPMQLSQALQRLGEGGTVVDPDVVGELIAARRNSEVLSCLTSKEREVLKLMAEGLSNKGIAERMFVSLDTVGSHVQPFSASSGHPLRRRQPADPRRSLVPARSLVRPPRSSKSATDITVSGDSRDRAPQLRSCLADREDTGDKTVVIAANPCIGFPRILTPANLSSE
jgi:DNA-binding NarL/FixJ family response regulator